jgi:hypothetical protein
MNIAEPLWRINAPKSRHFSFS